MSVFFKTKPETTTRAAEQRAAKKRKSSPSSRWLFSSLAAATLTIGAFTPLQAFAKDYSQLNIFGDSLVDSGNIFNLTGLPPSPPYANKLSNGDVWVEPFASGLGLAPSLATEAIPGIQAGLSAPPTDGINFALAGSLTSDLNTGSPSDPSLPQLPGLQQQVQTYRQLSPILSSDSDALFVLLAGGNDYNQAFFRPDLLATTLDDLPNQVTDNLTNAAAGLIDAGAKNLLVANLPNLGRQPFAQQLNALNPRSSTLLTALSAEHNQQLDQKLTALSSAADVHITQLDLGSFFENIAQNPDEFGFADVSSSCLTNYQPGFVFEGICDNPDEFVFWDNVHPTEAVHNEIAQFAIATLADAHDSGSENGNQEPKSVPEPSGVVGLLLLGGGVIAAKKQKP